MPKLTTSETLFEAFLKSNSIAFERIEPATELNERRPDYKVVIDDFSLIFEVTEISEDSNFGVVISENPRITSSQREPGSHIRSKISEKKKQLQWGVDKGIPSILVIYNKLDPFQMFGTEETDFIAAMDGEYTLRVNRDGLTSGIFNGRDQALRKDINTSISAIGHLCTKGIEQRIVLFENIFAKLRVPYGRLPSCFEVRLRPS